jgi:hypothetical protein
MSRSENGQASPAKRAALRQFVRRNLGGIIVLGVVLALAGPTAEANDEDPVLLGSLNDASSTTSIQTTSGDGLYGETMDLGSGVFGKNNGFGDGVRGESSLLNGVFGFSESPTASGVAGVNGAGGFAVSGEASNGGVAVLADNTDGTGTALRTTGKLEFQNRSGIATVAAGHKSVTVTLSGVTKASMVTATVQRTGGFFVQAAVPAAGSFKIFINKAPVSPATVKVAYLVLN